MFGRGMDASNLPPGWSPGHGCKCRLSGQAKLHMAGRILSAVVAWNSRANFLFQVRILKWSFMDTAKFLAEKYGHVLLTYDEVSEILRIGKKSLQNAISAGRYPGLAPSALHLFHVRDVAAFVDSQSNLMYQDEAN